MSISRASLVVGLAVVLSACSQTSSVPTPVPKRKAPQTTLVSDVTSPKELSFAGTVVAPRDAFLASSRGGRVEAHLAELGARVRRGQVVTRLGQGELVFASQVAAAGAKQAEARLGDSKAPDGAPSVLAAKASLDSAEDAAVEGGRPERQEARADLGRLYEMRAAVGQANAALDDRDLRVPFDGVVMQRFVEAGQMAAPHTPVVRVIDPSELDVRFEVPQNDASRVSVGAKTRIVVAGKSVSGAVFRESPGLVGEATTRLADARLQGPLDGVLPGMHTTIWVALPESETLIPIPVSATTSSAGVVRAWVLSDQRLRPRLLSVARYEGDLVFVRSGLQRGDALVTAPSPDFRVDEEVGP